MKFEIAGARIALLAACCSALLACDRGQPSGGTTTRENSVLEVVDLTWTQQAAERVQAVSAKDPAQYSLPEVRVYDDRDQLVFREIGFRPGEIDAMSRAIAGKSTVPGPSFAETVADLQSYDGRPGPALLKPARKVTVVDYWAEWCLPCKRIEKQLVDWAKRQPQGSVRLVRAETDLVKLSKARGGKAFKLIKNPDGTFRKVKM